MIANDVKINVNLQDLDKSTLIAMVEGILNAATDEAFAYDIDYDMAKRIKEELDDLEIPCEIVEEVF